MRSDYIEPELFDHILAALTPQNELAMRVSLATGLRISDVLNIKTSQVMKGNRFTVKEMKTGKTKKIYIPQYLHDKMKYYAGRYYVFESRLDQNRARSRQAVFKDLKRAAAAFRVSASINVCPHSARKDYAVESLKKYGSPAKVKNLLNHSNEAVTALYLLAEAITAQKLSGKPPKREYKKSTKK